MLDAGADPAEVLEEAKAAMTVLGDKFECEEVFIPELIMGGEIMKGIAEELKPRIKGEAAVADRGTIVLGTVAGDIHDIGKDVVVLMLDVNGYDVHDLGIDVPIEKFVAAIDELKPQVVGLSGLLTLAFDSMKATIDGIAAAGKRDQVKIMIGGSPGGRAGLRVHRRRRLGPRRGGRAAPGRRVDGECGMTPTPEELYAQREQRFNDVVALKKPDRVPVMPLYVHNFPTLIKGISNKDAGYDHETRWQSTKEATLRFGWNFAPTNDVLASDFFAAYGNKQIMWAGEEGGLADDAPFQWVEDEYVKADELAEFVADPNGFTFNKILPRMGSKLEGLGQIPLPPLYWFSNSYYLQVLGNMLGIPPLKAALQAMLDMAEAQEKTNAANGKYLQEMKDLGYPPTWGAALMPAFDVVSDTFRSLRGSTLDMFRQPDTLLQAVDVMQEATIGLLHAAFAVTGIPRQFIPMHKGAGGFMSNEQFAQVLLADVQGAHRGVRRGGHHADAAVRGRLHAAPRVPGGAAARQGRGALRPHRPQEVQGGLRRRPVLLGQRAELAARHRHPAAGQGRRQGARRPVRRDRAHHRRPGRHPRPGQARERRGARRGGRGVRRRSERRALDTLSPNIYRYAERRRLGRCGERNLQGGETMTVSHHSRWTRLAVVLAACVLVVLALALAGCGSNSGSSDSGDGGGEIVIGVDASMTGSARRLRRAREVVHRRRRRRLQRQGWRDGRRRAAPGQDRPLRRQERRQRGGQERRHADHQGQGRGHHRPDRADRRQPGRPGRRAPRRPVHRERQPARALPRRQGRQRRLEVRVRLLRLRRQPRQEHLPVARRLRPRQGDQHEVVATVVDNSSDGPVFDALWTANAKEYGWKEIEMPPYPSNATEFGSLITKLKESGADYVVALGDTPVLIALRKQMDAAGYKPKVMDFARGAQLQQFSDALGPLAEGIVIDSYWTPDTGYPGAAELGARFDKEADFSIGQMVGPSYATGQILMDAITDGQLHRPAEDRRRHRGHRRRVRLRSHQVRRQPHGHAPVADHAVAERQVRDHLARWTWRRRKSSSRFPDRG